jgi:hypothetical protein
MPDVVYRITNQLAKTVSCRGAPASIRRIVTG